MLLQILEDGYLSDAKGRKIDFTNTIIIMTSNIGAAKLQKEVSLGFRASKNSEISDLDKLHSENSSQVKDELKKLLRPELLNRIDKSIVFRALTKKDIYKVIDLQIEELASRLSKKVIGINLSKSAKDYLLDKGYDAHNGVRPLRRLIQETLENEIADLILNNSINKGDLLSVGVKKDELTYSVVNETSKAVL